MVKQKHTASEKGFVPRDKKYGRMSLDFFNRVDF